MKFIKTTLGDMINIESIAMYMPIEFNDNGVKIILNSGYEVKDENLSVDDIGVLIDMVQRDDAFNNIYSELINRDYHVLRISNHDSLYKERKIINS